MAFGGHTKMSLMGEKADRLAFEMSRYIIVYITCISIVLNISCVHIFMHGIIF